MQMKMRIRKRHPETLTAEAALVRFCAVLDSTIPTLRTAFLVLGLVAAALQTGQFADYLFVTGLLFHFAIWFEGWWGEVRAR
jgi:hypothetical protein